MTKTVVFTGPMGAGKSSIGRRVAKKIGASFTDTDSVIVARHGAIATIFSEHGEDEFRRIEREIVAEAVAGGGVVALGGGAVLAPETRELLRDHLVIFLDVDEHTISARIRGAKRPLLNEEDPVEAWKRIANARRPIYEAIADVRYDTSHGPIKAVVESAAEWARERIGTKENENER
ncbi:shikimate kinase [Microbacterium nanhaiense]|uniref:Shikimate kinase n=1 Tax=Microbacterium nanhaiense TaxID=1301026 RepID=A0ABQ2MYL5_9MICO|nr:shikimate kinase [Microbacterium nanhaiense]GGO61787.1 shikimate kinase [Microbacterium nanhaiense]